MATKVKNPTLATAMKVIRYAIKNKKAVSSSCLDFNLGATYVSDVKKRLSNRIETGVITKDEARLFTEVYDKYVEKVK